MSKIADPLDSIVQETLIDTSLLGRLSAQIVPIMMHLSLDSVHRYQAELTPLLDSLQPGSEEYTYLLIVLSFLAYRQSNYTEVINTLNAYELTYEHNLKDPMFVSVNALIGACYRSLGQAEFALEYFQRNIPYIQIERGDHSYFYSLTLYHIAELYGELQEYEAMLDRHKLNLEFFDPTAQVDFYFRTLNGVGRAYRGLHDFNEALKYLLDVEEKSEGKGNIPFRARNLHDLGALYAELDQVDESLAFF